MSPAKKIRPGCSRRDRCGDAHRNKKDREKNKVAHTPPVVEATPDDKGKGNGRKNRQKKGT